MGGMALGRVRATHSLPRIGLDAAAALIAAAAAIPLHEEFHKISLLVMGAKGNVENWGTPPWMGFCGFTVSPSQWPWFCLAGGLGVSLVYMPLWALVRKRLPLLGLTLLLGALVQLGYALWESQQ